MKRCPECRRDYYDDSLLYCLDDGNALLEGPASGSEQPTAILSNDDGNKTNLKPPAGKWRMVGAVAVVALLAIIGSYFYLNIKEGSQRPAASKDVDYLRAKMLVANENRKDVESAILLLESAVRVDPRNASAWAQLARAYNKKAFYFASGDERKQLNADAEVAVERSLALDPNLGEGHFARGLVIWTHAKRFPHELAVQSYRRAIELDPKLDEAHHQLGLIYLHIGMFDRSRAEIAQALAINPANILARFRYGVIDLYEQKYENAQRFFRSTPPEQTPAIQTFQAATVSFKLGRVDEATQLINKYLKDNPQDEGGVATSVRAMILASEGRTDEAIESIKRADEIGREFGHFHHTAFNIACAYAMMGREEDAIKYMEMAAEDGFPCYPLYAAEESFAKLRQSTAYESLLKRLKQQWDAFNSTL